MTNSTSKTFIIFLIVLQFGFHHIHCGIIVKRETINIPIDSYDDEKASVTTENSILVTTQRIIDDSITTIQYTELNTTKISSTQKEISESTTKTSDDQHVLIEKEITTPPNNEITINTSVNRTLEHITIDENTSTVANELSTMISVHDDLDDESPTTLDTHKDLQADNTDGELKLDEKISQTTEAATVFKENSNTESTTIDDSIPSSTENYENLSKSSQTILPTIEATHVSTSELINENHIRKDDLTTLSDIKLRKSTDLKHSIPSSTIQTESESRNYDIATNEIKNSTKIPATPTSTTRSSSSGPSEKRGKDFKHTNTPTGADVLPLSRLSLIEPVNSSVATKIATDFATIIQNNLTNSIENILDGEKSSSQQTGQQVDDKNFVTLSQSPSTATETPQINSNDLLSSSVRHFVTTPSFNGNKVDYEDIEKIPQKKFNEKNSTEILDDDVNENIEIVEANNTSAILLPNRAENSTDTDSQSKSTGFDRVVSTSSSFESSTTSITNSLTENLEITLSPKTTTELLEPLSTSSEKSEQSTTVDSDAELLSTTESKTTNESSIESNITDKVLVTTDKQLPSTTREIESTGTTQQTHSKTESTTISHEMSNSIDQQFSKSTIPQSISTDRNHEYSVHTTQRSHNNELIVELTTSTALAKTINASSEPVESTQPPNETDYNVIIAISVSVIGIVALILIVGFFYVIRKRQKQVGFAKRCTPIDRTRDSIRDSTRYGYNLDHVVKGGVRSSKRAFGNIAFDDPSLKHNLRSAKTIGKFVENRSAIYEEFDDIPQIIARQDEVPKGCEDKNRYANIVALPETRVMLSRQQDDEKSEYINANYVRGPNDSPNYYIACQAPLETTVTDFWRMIWEQNSRVIIAATDLLENGIEKCAEYIPVTVSLDLKYDNYTITLNNREVKDKYVVSSLDVKNTEINISREITHLWYQWPEKGVPNDEAGVIAMLLEARSYLKQSTIEQNGINQTIESIKQNDGNTDENISVSNGSLDKTKSLTTKIPQGPLTVHCSPGTGRSGTIIACDIAIRSLETPKRSVDIPHIVYYVRCGRAKAVETKEQYEFIYRVANVYATKITAPPTDN